jgi:hypothetical protein
VKQVHQLAETKTTGPLRPSVQRVDLSTLAGVADALLADGRGELAADVVEVLFYCADRQLGSDNVVPISSANFRLWLARLVQRGADPANG